MFKLLKKKEPKKSIGVYFANLHEISICSAELSRCALLIQLLESKSCEVITQIPRGERVDGLVKDQIKDLNVPLRFLKKPHSKSGSTSEHGKLAGEAYDALETLKGSDYDAIFFFGPIHHAYYIIQQKFLKRGFIKTNLNLHVDRLYIERLMRGEVEMGNYADVARIFMEERSILRADNVFTFSATIQDELEKHQILMDSKRFFNMGFVENKSCQRFTLPYRQSPKNVKTLIFFGRLDHTGGLTTFVYALEHLFKEGKLTGINEIYISGELNPDFPADEFLGRTSSYINKRLDILKLTSKAKLFRKISNGTTLTVVAPNFKESPVIVEELLTMNIPVLLSSQVTISNINPQDYPSEIIFEPHYLEMAKSIGRVIENGYNHDTKSFLKHNRKDAQVSLNVLTESNKESNSEKSAEQPLVTICVAHFNRFESLKTTLNSILHQTYKNIEIIIVDDGSEQSELAKLREYIRQFDDIKLICQPNLYLGAARNTAAKKARGKYLLFKDDDNISKPHEVENFVNCAEMNNSEILVCFSENFRGSAESNDFKLNGVVRLPFGADPIYGMLKNGLGDSNCFMKSSIWKKLGGFTEHYKVGLDDQEFFLRAIVSGISLEVIPEPLYFYRLGGEKMKRFHVSETANEERILSPLFDTGHIDKKLLPIVKLTRQLLKN